MTRALVELQGVEVVYHRVATAIQGVSLTVASGGVTAIIGVNGAGKTTTLKAISGFLGTEDARVTAGRILFEGREITGWPPHRTARLGVALVPEREKVFETLTVEENLRVSCPPDRDWSEAFDLFPRLAELRRRPAGYLSGGEKQMLALAMALLGRPRLLMVDELSLGLAPAVTARLLGELLRLRRELGFTLLLVEQNAAIALAVADYGYVMEDGRVVFAGTAERLRQHGDIREFYLGYREGEDVRSYREVKQYRRKRRWWS